MLWTTNTHQIQLVELQGSCTKLFFHHYLALQEKYNRKIQTKQYLNTYLIFKSKIPLGFLSFNDQSHSVLYIHSANYSGYVYNTVTQTQYLKSVQRCTNKDISGKYWQHTSLFFCYALYQISWYNNSTWFCITSNKLCKNDVIALYRPLRKM